MCNSDSQSELDLHWLPSVAKYRTAIMYLSMSSRSRSDGQEIKSCVVIQSNARSCGDPDRIKSGEMASTNVVKKSTLGATVGCEVPVGAAVVGLADGVLEMVGAGKVGAAVGKTTVGGGVLGATVGGWIGGFVGAASSFWRKKYVTPTLIPVVSSTRHAITAIRFQVKHIYSSSSLQ
jgi:hypothetical protein